MLETWELALQASSTTLYHLEINANTSEVTLYPGETIKVPFTLVNLGSEGSFLFQVTKTSSLISYVIPFSLALNTNASTTGHMVIASRGNTSEVKTISVRAVAQSDTVMLRFLSHHGDNE